MCLEKFIRLFVHSLMHLHIPTHAGEVNGCICIACNILYFAFFYYHFHLLCIVSFNYSLLLVAVVCRCCCRRHRRCSCCCCCCCCFHCCCCCGFIAPLLIIRYCVLYLLICRNPLLPQNTKHCMHK